jgi:hypothetical protein
MDRVEVVPTCLPLDWAIPIPWSPTLMRSLDKLFLLEFDIQKEINIIICMYIKYLFLLDYLPDQANWLSEMVEQSQHSTDNARPRPIARP